ncbi:hypothetical protein LXA43DRAFT_892193 [Ganoderma leucocontextum]|nr:hypothetical protein LXA43DRAFT_892193 [Ganoderma leucocontextum]
MAPHPVNSQVTFVNQAQCAGVNCRKTNVSRSCTNKMCKSCCVELGAPCGYNAHAKARRTLANQARSAAAASFLAHPVPVDGFTMIRPEPISPPVLHSRAVPVEASSTAPAIVQAISGATAVSSANTSTPRFRKVMDVPWQKEWDESQKKKREVLAGEETLRAHRESLVKSIVVWFWRQNGQPPERYPVQGIVGWPYFRAADHPDLLQKLSVSANERLQGYVLPSRRWEDLEVGEVVKVYSHQVFLWRANGVVDCLDIDRRIQEAGRQRAGGVQSLGDPLSSPPTMQVTIMAPPTHSRRKRVRAEDGPSFRPTASRQAFRRPSPFLSDLPSPCTPPPPSSTPSTPSSSPELLAPAMSVPGSTTPPSPASSDVPPSPFLHDQLWAQGSVYVPSSVHLLGWPKGMFSRDMIEGFRLLSKVNRSKLPEEFPKVFPGVKFTGPTYYKQEHAWKYSTEAERKMAASLPRNGRGLWASVRQSLTGWQG